MRESLLSKREIAEMAEDLKYYDEHNPLNEAPCTVNRICWLFEKEFDRANKGRTTKEANGKAAKFDYTIMKSDAEYTPAEFKIIKKLKLEYDDSVSRYMKARKAGTVDTDTPSTEYISILQQEFMWEALAEVPNEKVLCNIVLDVCYGTSKYKNGKDKDATKKNMTFAWAVCGDVIVGNLRDRANGLYEYPRHVEADGDFTYQGEHFVMVTGDYGNGKWNMDHAGGA